MNTAEEIKSNLDSVEKRIASACERAGRNREDISLIAVSKTNPVEAVVTALGFGQKAFGENRVQELCEKDDYIKQNGITVPEWHLIGHLQTNKVKNVIGRVDMIHSVDSLKLAGIIDKESKNKGLITKILLEVNIASEESKFGVLPQDAVDLAMSIAELKNVKLCGLMTVAPITENPESNRPYFRKMRELSVDIASKNKDNISMNVLSMGMTGDFEVAIEEGATHVRVGTGIFGKRDYTNKEGLI